MMLFDGLLESIATARGHIQHRNIAEKSKALARASRIVLGLQGALDFDRGGDLAQNLNELYGYVTRRLLHANAHNDLSALDEVHGLISEIRGAWETVPSLVPANPQPTSALN
jgi:flagellar protein FliS